MFILSLFPTWRKCPARVSCGNINMKTWHNDKGTFFYVCPQCNAAELKVRHEG